MLEPQGVKSTMAEGFRVGTFPVATRSVLVEVVMVRLHAGIDVIGIGFVTVGQVAVVKGFNAAFGVRRGCVVAGR